jgi:hypothetical protein
VLFEAAGSSRRRYQKKYLCWVSLWEVVVVEEESTIADEVQMLRNEEVQMLRNEEVQMLRNEEVQMLRNEEMQMLRNEEVQMLRSEEVQMLRSTKGGLRVDTEEFLNGGKEEDDHASGANMRSCSMEDAIAHWSDSSG